MIKFTALFQHRRQNALKYKFDVLANNVEHAIELSIHTLWYIMAEDHNQFYPVEIHEIEDHDLEKGEIIKQGDECDVSNGINTDPVWTPAKCIGEEAPDPDYLSHRIYRRSLASLSLSHPSES
jgi:hypothetical protein